MVKIRKDIEDRYPTLIGYSITGKAYDLHGVQNVAEFICEKGTDYDIAINEPNGSFFLNTCGIYVDKIVDKEYRRELLKVLVPMQMIIEHATITQETEVSM